MRVFVQYTCAFAASVLSLSASNAPALQRFGQLPLSFEENRGQAAPEARYISRGPGYSLALSDNGVTLALHGHKDEPIGISWPPRGNAKPVGEKLLPSKSNYLIGNDAAHWRKGIVTYGAVRYAGIAPGIGLVFYGNQSRLEYDLVLDAGADLKSAQLQFTGVKRIEILRTGDLILHTASQDVLQRVPVIYQQIHGKKVRVTGGYRLRGENAIGFQVSNYDHSRALIVDPSLEYSGYIESSLFGENIAVDNTGAVYVAGFTTLSDFPMVASGSSPVFQNNNKGGQDIVVFKINPSGQAIEYFTFIGGSGDDTPYSIAVDGSGRAFVSGTTDSSDFPKKMPSHDWTFGPAPSFVLALNPSGSDIIFSDLFSTDTYQHPIWLTADTNGSVYVTGTTNPQSFPTTAGAYQTSYGSETYMSFVMKLSSAGELVWSTLFAPSTQASFGQPIKVDDAGSVYILGMGLVGSTPITAGAYESTSSSEFQLFVAKLASDGSQLLFSTFLGNGSSAPSVAIDQSGIYVLGSVTNTSGICAPTNRPPDRTDSDIAIAKLNLSGTALLYCFSFGSTQSDVGGGLVVDSQGNAYVIGQTEGTDFPVTANAIQTVSSDTNEGGSPFVSEVNASGTGLIFSTYLGGSGNGAGTAIARDSQDAIYTVAWEGSPPSAPPFPPLFEPTASNASIGVAITKITASNCTYSVSPNPLVEPINSHINATITTQSGCNWIVGNAAPWISPSQNFGTGTQLVSLYVGQNAGQPRSATISLAGQSVLVAPVCHYTVSPASMIFTGPANVLFKETPSDDSCVPTVTSNVDWLLAGNAEYDPGYVFVTDQTTGHVPTRTGTVTIGDQTVTITHQELSDVNADGYSDVAWQDPVSGASQLWLMGGGQGTTSSSIVGLGGPNAWRLVAMAKFGSQGNLAQIWQDPVSGSSQVWFLGGPGGTTVLEADSLSGPNTWRIAAVADMDLDGNADLIWQDPITGASQIWYLGGPKGLTVRGTAFISGPNSWRIAGVEPTDQGFTPNLIWQDPVSGTSQRWSMGGQQGATLQTTLPLSGPNNWRIAGIADFDGNGSWDFVWQDPVTGASQVWLTNLYYMGGYLGYATLSGPNTWRIAGRSQLLWP